MSPKLLPDDEISQAAVDGMVNATLKTCEMISELAHLSEEELALQVVARILAYVTSANNTDSVNVAMAHMDGAWHTHIHLDYLDADPVHVLDASARD